MRSKLDMILLLLILLLSMVAEKPIITTNRQGGEVLWRMDQSTLYRCGPDNADICFDDGVGVTKVYVGE